MTDEKDHNKDEPRTAGGEDAPRHAWSGREVAIGQALQRAAGLPASGPLLCRENPWLADSGGAHPPILDTAIKKILGASSPLPNWHKPRAVESKLEKVRDDIRRLRNSIASLEDYTDYYGFNLNCYIDNNGDPSPVTERIIDEAAQAEFDALADDDKTASEMAGFYFVPPEEYTVAVALAAMAKLDAAIVLTIEEAIEASAKLKETGRIPNVVAHGVARVVAEYVREVTGNLPGPRRKYSGSDFERTLVEIFELLKIKADAQAPAKAALLELAQND